MITYPERNPLADDIERLAKLVDDPLAHAALLLAAARIRQDQPLATERLHTLLTLAAEEQAQAT